MLNSRGDAVDGAHQSGERGLVFAVRFAPAAQPFHLRQADRIDLRAAQPDRQAQPVIVSEQGVSDVREIADTGLTRPAPAANLAAPTEGT